MISSPLFVPWMPRDFAFGDQLQNAGMLAQFPEKAPDTTLAVRRELLRLFSPLWRGPVVALDDVSAEDLSWRVGLGNPQGQPPPIPLPFFVDDRIKIDRDPDKTLIGLAWHGSFGGRSQVGLLDDPRVIPPKYLAPLLALDGVDIVALEFSDTPMPIPGVTYLDERGVVDFSDTAGILKQLDLVITVDTAVAHLAGQLDVPTWLMLMSPAHSMFDHGRWGTEPSLYRSVRQLNQELPGDWSSLIGQVTTSLNAIRNGSRK